MIRSGEHCVRDGVTAQFIFDPAARSLTVVWKPWAPLSIKPSELRRYRSARNRFLQRVAAELGGPVVVVDA